jgi:hypothetical protein
MKPFNEGSTQDRFETHKVINIFYNGILTRCNKGKMHAFCRFNENDNEIIRAGVLRQVYQDRLLYVNQPEVFYNQWGLPGYKFEDNSMVMVQKASNEEWDKLVPKEKRNASNAFDEKCSMIIKYDYTDPKNVNNPKEIKTSTCYKLGNHYKSKVADNLVFGLLNRKLYVLLAIDMKTGFFRTHGGHVEGKETGTETAVREYEEETSFEINPNNVIAKFEIERRLAPEIQESRRGYVVDLPGEYVSDGDYELHKDQYDSEYVKVNNDYNSNIDPNSKFQIHGNQLLKTYKDDCATSKMITTVNVNLCTITEKDLQRRGLSDDPSEVLYTMFVDVDGLTYIRKNRLFQWDMHSALVEEGLSFCRKYIPIDENSRFRILNELVSNIRSWKTKMIALMPKLDTDVYSIDSKTIMDENKIELDKNTTMLNTFINTRLTSLL